MSEAKQLLFKSNLRLVSQPKLSWAARALSWLKEKRKAMRTNDLTFEEWQRLEFKTTNNTNLRRYPYV